MRGRWNVKQGMPAPSRCGHSVLSRFRRDGFLSFWLLPQRKRLPLQHGIHVYGNDLLRLAVWRILSLCLVEIPTVHVRKDSDRQFPIGVGKKGAAILLPYLALRRMYNDQ